MDGDTQKEALVNAKKAAGDYLEALIEDGRPIPLSIFLSNEASQNFKAGQSEGYFVEEIKITLR